MSDDPLKECPSCGKNKLRRLIGGGLGVIFKGSGFYSTDSRGGGSSKKSAEGTDSSKTSDGSETAAKTETKTESKTEASKSDSGSKAEKSSSKKEGAGVAG
jgi:predicted nucleic acid-binding Zn ribbon protein